MARQRCRKLSDGEKIRKLNAAAIFFRTAIRTLIRHEIRYELVPAIRIPLPYIFECAACARVRARISSARTPINCATAIIVIRACSRPLDRLFVTRRLRKWSRSAAQSCQPRFSVRAALFVKSGKKMTLARRAARRMEKKYLCNSHLWICFFFIRRVTLQPACGNISLTLLFEMAFEINEHPFPKRDVICMLIANTIFRVSHQGGTCGYVAIIRRSIIITSILYVTFSGFFVFN